jgi:hypothetical protein
MRSRTFPVRILIFACVGLGLYPSVKAQDCKCPEFEIVSQSEMVKAGGTVEFKIVSIDQSLLQQKYSWTVSSGTIIRGQGTGKVVVQTTEDTPSAKPTPTSSPLPRDFLGSISIQRRVPKLTVTASLAASECSCRTTSASVQIGGENREKNSPAEVTDLRLSTEKLSLPCKPGYRPADGVTVSESMVVDVSVTAHDPENDVLLYNYTVSGGRVVGIGSNVKWDLSGVATGTYTITAEADDGCGNCGKNQVRTVSVAEECSVACGLCECPTVEIYGPKTGHLSAGENIFTANVLGGVWDVTYDWSVPDGTIISGQGTPSIGVVFSDTVIKSNASIILKIGGINPECACLTEHSVEYVNGRRKP